MKTRARPKHKAHLDRCQAVDVHERRCNAYTRLVVVRYIGRDNVVWQPYAVAALLCFKHRCPPKGL